MERKDSDLDSDGDFGEKEIYGEGSDGEDDSCGEKAPRSDAVAIREGYNQTYIVKSSDNNLHQVLFRCGNWCYTGNVDLGSSVIGLSEIVSAIPALQKQQGSLQFMCEWKKMPVNSIYTRPLNILYDTFDFIGDELVSEHITAALEKAATTFDWVDAEDAKNYFELQTEGLDCFKDVDIVASKTFVRELVLLIIYYQRSFYVVLQEGKGDQPLLDVRFPDLSEHLQGMQLQTYPGDDTYKKLLLWQAVERSGAKSIPKPIKVKTKDISGIGYTQTFLIRKIKPNAQNTLREILFRFGNWCYNGHVDLGPRLELGDIPIVIPLLRRQQSALTFMCEASGMPATSLFAKSMEYLADIMPVVQQELLKAEGTLMDLAEKGYVEGVGDITSWLEDDSADCYFELGLADCEELDEVEVIASKVYLSGIVLVVLYYQSKLYVTVQDGANEQPLLDTRFPDITCPSRGFQLETYHRGVKGFPELRRISLWRAGAPQVEPEMVNRSSAVSPMDEKMKLIDQKADTKKTDGNSTTSPSNSPKQSTNNNEAKADAKGLPRLGKVARPHHIAPMKSASDLKGRLKTLGPVTDASSAAQIAPWDKTGKPLGSLGSRK